MGAGHSRNLYEAAAANELDRARHFMKEDKKAVTQADKVCRASLLLRCPSCRRPAYSLSLCLWSSTSVRTHLTSPLGPSGWQPVRAGKVCASSHSVPRPAHLTACARCRTAGRPCTLQRTVAGEMLTMQRSLLVKYAAVLLHACG